MTTQYQEIMAAAFEDELEKLAQEKTSMSHATMKTVGLVGAGAVGAETLRRAERDRRTGRMVRMQQGY